MYGSLAEESIGGISFPEDLNDFTFKVNLTVKGQT